MLISSCLSKKMVIFLIPTVLFAFLLFQTIRFAKAEIPHSGTLSDTAKVTDVSITLVKIADGFSAPVQVTHAGDGSGRLFIVEQPGTIKILRDDLVVPQDFLDIRSLVAYGGERGLLGLTFHPDYPNNGFFYLNYTRAGDGATVIARYRVSGTNPDVADLLSGETLMVIPQPYSNHNGGQLLFSPIDGYLYIGMGDGGSGGDPLDHGQNMESLLGAMLRIDVNGPAPYAIPPDNPYVNKPGLDEIWALGLRNPWRFSFDRLSGDMYIGDVGQNLWEEVSFQASGTAGGLNFGWRCMEGFHVYNFSETCQSAVLTDPILEYSHSVGRSITGGFVYRGVDYPALYGRYFYADYVTGRIWSIQKQTSDPVTWSQPELMLESGLNISAFGEDESGELYLTAISQNALYKVVDVNGPIPNFQTSQKYPSRFSADVGEVVTYTIVLENTGGMPSAPLFFTDTVPAGLVYIPGTFTASVGIVDDHTALPNLFWQGDIGLTRVMTLTYNVSVTGSITGSLINKALVTSPAGLSLTLFSSLHVPRSVITTTKNDFVMPGTQPGSLEMPIQPSVDCNICHSEAIFDKWRGSMMSQAGRDPLFWTAVSVANVDAPDSGEMCLRCHLSTGWLEGRSHPSDGSGMVLNDIANGVACALCHRLVDSVPSVSDETVALDLVVRNALTMPVPLNYTGGATLIIDPHDNRRGPFSFSPPVPYHTAYQSDYLGQESDAVTRSRLCGSCHNVDNPVLQWDAEKGQYWPNDRDTPAQDFDGTSLFPVERTFDEWLYSQYASEGVYAPQFAGEKPNKIVSACQDCHMTRLTGYAVDSAYNPVLRDCEDNGCLPEHRLVGGNTWLPQVLRESTWRLNAIPDSGYLQETEAYARVFLNKAATVTVTLTSSDTLKLASVRVTNQTGHKLPTGYPEGRQMWLHVQAFDADKSVIYESGAYDFSSGQLIRDADIKVYEIKQGLTSDLASYLSLPVGESFHFVLNNTVVKDNRIPPRGVLQAEYDRPGLKPVGALYLDDQHWDDTIYVLPETTTSVKATLYYQTASREYITFLERHSGVDGDVLKDIWLDSKSPPVIVAQVWVPNYSIYVPLTLRSD